MERAVLVTHNDFDGVTCAILFKAFYQCAGKYYLENYDTVNERIKEVITQEKPDVLIIADISPSKETAQALDQYAIELVKQERGFVQLLDHHKTARWLAEKYDYWAIVDTTRCGASLLLDFLSEIYDYVGVDTRVLWEYEDLVYHANDYDLWKHESPHSSVLNSLLYAIGPERFIKRFVKNPSVQLTGVEMMILEIEQEKEEKYIEEAVKNAKITDRYAVTMAERCISQIGARLLELAPIAVIVNAQKGIVSLRGSSVDVAEIAKKAGGGGHARAAGFTLPKHLFHDEIIDLLAEIEGI